MFLNKKEYDELIDNVSKSLSFNFLKEDDLSKMSLDEILPLTSGYEDDFETAGNQSYKGMVCLESIEERLLKLFEDVGLDDALSNSAANQSADTKKDMRPGQGQVGTTEVLGHSKGTDDPSTPAKAQQINNSSFAVRGKAEKAAEEQEDQEGQEKQGSSEEPHDTLEGVAQDLGIVNET